MDDRKLVSYYGPEIPTRFRVMKAPGLIGKPWKNSERLRKPTQPKEKTRKCGIKMLKNWQMKLQNQVFVSQLVRVKIVGKKKRLV